MNGRWLLTGFLVASSSLFCSCSEDKPTDPEQPTAPLVSTAAVSAVTQTTAECGGTVTSDGGTTVTSRGVCWSTNATPTVAHDKTTDGTGSGVFTSSITGLTAGTPYYARAYATNSAGTGYGNAQSFTTAASTGTVTDIDGNVYQTVTIGTQVWMAENLRVTHYRNGEDIPKVTSNAEWQNLTTGACCEYDNDINTVSTYGRYYNWYAVNDSRRIAPVGWRVPSDEDWQVLIDYLGGESAAGGKMKETGTSHWNAPNGSATNESGFNARGAGHRNWDGAYIDQKLSAWFWSSTEDNSTDAWYRSLYYDYGGVSRDNYLKLDAFTIRCLQGEAPVAPTVTDIDGNVYETVTIGGQVWMAENLKVTHYRNGDPIPDVTDGMTWEGLTTGALCRYSNSDDTAAIYGLLYNWHAVNDSRSIAPDGWHVPTQSEWSALNSYLAPNAGGQLKGMGTTYWFSPNEGATNETGFTALPGGQRGYQGVFGALQQEAYFWTSTESTTSSRAYAFSLHSELDYISERNLNKYAGHSVRCVRD